MEVPPPLELALQRFPNERNVTDSVWINGASLIFISPVTQESVCSLAGEAGNS